MTTVSATVEEVVSSDPILQQCIARGIVNYSKLAKALQPIVSQLLGRNVSVDSIKMALIRYSSRVSWEKQQRREVLEVIAKSSVEIRTDITIITVRSSAFNYIMPILSKLALRARFIAIMQSVVAATIVLDRESAEAFLSSVRSEDIIDVQRDQAALVIVSPDRKSVV